jgi:hypothetical protein
MSSSVLVSIGLAAEVAAVGFSAVTGYRAFSLSRALPGPVYRVRSEWTWIFSVLMIGITGIFFAADVGLFGSYIGDFLTGVNSYLVQFAIVVLLAWVSSTISVAFEQDFFHRDTWHWSSLRRPFWVGVASSVNLWFFGEGLKHCDPLGCGSYLQYEPFLTGASEVIIVVLIVYASVVLYVSALRTPDKTLSSHVRWMVPFVATAAIAFVLYQFYGIFIAIGSYFLFRASGFLSPADPLGSVEIQGVGVAFEQKSSELGWQKYRTVSISLIFISVLLAAVILVEDGLLKKLSISSSEALTSVMFVYGVLIVLLITKTRLGFTLSIISSTLMLFVQLVNDLAPPSGFQSPADIAKFFPNGFTSYVLGLSPVYDQTLCPFACPPFLYSAAIFLAIQVPLIAACYLGLRAERRASYLGRRTVKEG